MIKKLFGSACGFSDDLRRTLADARNEAVRLGHDYVGPEHQLIAASRDHAVADILGRFGIDPEQLRATVEQRIRVGAASVALGKLAYSLRAKKVLECTLAEARETQSPEVRTQHLFLGLLRVQDGIASIVLGELGVTLEKARVLSADERGKDRRFRIHIDDTSDRSIYEQIVAQITEASAAGGLEPGERLPTVRQLADELDVAPGTVARAYSELERRALVVTDGVRGTRVADRSRAAVPAAVKADTLIGLLRPVAVAAFHLGATAEELRVALDSAMRGIFDKPTHAA